MNYIHFFDGSLYKNLLLFFKNLLDPGQIQSITGQIIWAIIVVLTLSSFIILLFRSVNVMSNMITLSRFRRKWNRLTENMDLQDDDRISEIAESLSRRSTVSRLVRRMVLLRRKHSSFDYASFFENTLSQYSNKLYWVRWVLSILIVLGLLGTVLGLREAINALHLAGNQTREVLETMIRDTMGGLGTAFNTTLWGIIGMLVVSLCFYFYLAVRGHFLNKLDLFLQDAVVPVLFPNPQHVLMESYHLMTREFTKTQEAIKESNTGFIENLQKVSRDMMASYKSTFEDLKEQFTSLNKTTSNLTRELAGNYENTQSILETIGQVATSFRQGTMNLEKSHTF
ncbi:MAG TPA: MotA/TolQ/ExbB proton channel family protein, partial [bacterium]|nr:MotA/TolQ/ExbB proton channel family protein [bacterium]